MVKNGEGKLWNVIDWSDFSVFLVFILFAELKDRTLQMYRIKERAFVQSSTFLLPSLFSPEQHSFGCLMGVQ